MQRANLVLDHTLAVLRDHFRSVLLGGFFNRYNAMVSLPMLDPAPTEPVLYWDGMLIGADTPRGLIPEVPQDVEKEDTRNLVEMDVQIARERATSPGGRGGRPSAYEMEMAIAVNVGMKEARWGYRLIHALFGEIESALENNSNLCHPETGEVGASLVEYRNYEINVGNSGLLLLAEGEGLQNWRVVPLTNKTIGLTPRPATP